jgi:SAM-dependent methyltransferase
MVVRESASQSPTSICTASEAPENNMTDNHEIDVSVLRAQLIEWKQGIPSESLFWDRWMQERGGQWPEEFRQRFDPETPLDPCIAAIARGMDKPEVTILDVGSGPAPATGYKLEGTALRITAVDPLASIYKNLLARHRLSPPVAPTFAPAEELSSFFEPNSFDIVHCRNALDHSFDPLRGISEMLKVVRISGLILLRHYQNEAEHGEYDGFHHYNFDCRGDRFVIWNQSMLVDIGDFLSGQAQVSCTMPGYVEVKVRKISDPLGPSEAHRDRMRQYLEALVDVVAA